MKKVMERGFTLIELLVVIAIIGILAAVVLASLNDARDGGKDASAKASLNSVRNQAELYYNGNGYAYDADDTNDADGVCGDADVTGLMTASDNQTNQTADCNESNTAYAVGSLLSDGATWYCVDSTGFAGEPTAALGADATVCP